LAASDDYTRRFFSASLRIFSNQFQIPFDPFVDVFGPLPLRLAAFPGASGSSFFAVGFGSSLRSSFRPIMYAARPCRRKADPQGGGRVPLEVCRGLARGGVPDLQLVIAPDRRQTAVRVPVRGMDPNDVRLQDVDTLAGAGATTGRNASKTDTGAERSIPVVREDLQVGKRTVLRGGVRVYSRMVEEPIEEQVRLRDEHVHVERLRVASNAWTDAAHSEHAERGAGQLGADPQLPPSGAHRRVRGGRQAVAGAEVDVLPAFLQALLDATPEGVSQTDIAKLFSGHERSTRLRRVLYSLEAAGLIRRRLFPTKGTPLTLWYALPEAIDPT